MILIFHVTVHSKFKNNSHSACLVVVVVVFSCCCVVFCLLVCFSGEWVLFLKLYLQLICFGFCFCV